MGRIHLWKGQRRERYTKENRGKEKKKQETKREEEAGGDTGQSMRFTRDSTHETMFWWVNQKRDIRNTQVNSEYASLMK